MKHFILSCLATACLLIACNSNKSKDPATKDEASTDKSTEVTSNNTAQNTADEMQKRLEEMRKLPALTTDQIKAMLPTMIKPRRR